MSTSRNTGTSIDDELKVVEIRAFKQLQEKNNLVIRIMNVYINSFLHNSSFRKIFCLKKHLLHVLYAIVSSVDVVVASIAEGC